MLKHLTKKNLKILFNAVGNEPLSQIFKNGFNSLIGKPKKEPVHSFAEDILFKIEKYEITKNNALTLTGWALSDQEVKSISILNETLNIEFINLGIKRKDVSSIFPKADHALHSGFSIHVSNYANQIKLEFKVKTSTETFFVTKSLDNLDNVSWIETSVLNDYFNPHPDLHESKDVTPYKASAKDPKVICYYLPQFHQIPENDDWWGEGFTEWTNVTKSIPKFKEHYQPRLPSTLGFYDLSNVATLRKQAKLAKDFGIHGFCMHYYWFSNKKLLETPLRLWSENKDIDLKICINWANENWTRSWDGKESDILVEQSYSKAHAEQFFLDLLPILTDPRYIKLEGKPLILIYRPLEVDDLAYWISTWRKLAIEHNIGPLCIAGCQSVDYIKDLKNLDLDISIQFPPHHIASYNPTLQKLGYEITDNYVNDPKKIFYDNKFKGQIFDYWNVSASSWNVSYPEDMIEGVMPSWDNSARKNEKGTPFVNSNPYKYYSWLSNALSRSGSKKHNMVFINAWNEWAEGAYLEPDRHFGYAYLNATKKALKDFQLKLAKREDNKSRKIAVVLHLYYEDLWQEFSEALKNIPGQFDLFVSLRSESQIANNILEKYPNAKILRLPNRGRDVGPFFEIMKHVKDYDYVLKLHTKKSLHASNGDEWRRYNLDTLLGSKDQVSKILNYFESEADLGLISGKMNTFSFREWGLGSNYQDIYKIGILLGLDNKIDQLKSFCDRQSEFKKLHNKTDNKVILNEVDGIAEEQWTFPAGTMFWFKPKALEGLFEIGLGQSDFPNESGQLDGTLAHAIERMVSIIVKNNGFDIKPI